MSRTIRWSAGTNAALGVWLIVAPFAFGVESSIAIWNYILVGGIIAVLAGYNAITAGEDEQADVKRATIVSLLGLWVIASPFLLGFPDPIGFWNSILTGALIATIASYAAYEVWDRAVDVETQATF